MDNVFSHSDLLEKVYISLPLEYNTTSKLNQLCCLTSYLWYFLF